MEFSDFAGRLHAIIGAGSSTSAFTKSIIEAILADDAPEITDEYSEDTYKAYFNGKTGITRLAKKITAHIEPFNFSVCLALSQPNSFWPFDKDDYKKKWFDFYGDFDNNTDYIVKFEKGDGLIG